MKNISYTSLLWSKGHESDTDNGELSTEVFSHPSYGKHNLSYPQHEHVAIIFHICAKSCLYFYDSMSSFLDIFLAMWLWLYFIFFLMFYLISYLMFNTLQL